MDRAAEKPALDVLVYVPNQAAEASWMDAALVRDARALAGAVVRADLKGRESLRFGLTVSGQVALYSKRGELLFTGGVTQSRGHVGENAGRTAMMDLLAGRAPAVKSTPVFGCSIVDESDGGE
jgi:hypothetical protein